MSKFIDLWHETREKNNSNIIAGLDPAPFALGRGDSGLPEDVDLRQWSLSFVEAVAPHVAGIKFNQAFYQGSGQRTLLRELVDLSKSHGLLTISDNKVADIGSTNDAWFYHTKELGFDFVTCAPYAGNIAGSIESAHKHELGIIIMGLMSNPEFKNEMYYQHPETGEALWSSRVKTGLEAGVEGMVVGGTYTKDNEAFMELVTMTADSGCLYLVPGIGFQGGTVDDFLASGIDAKQCMICSSRGVMFPNGSNSTAEEQADAAMELQMSFNKIAYGN